jgi:hypothetical protein
VVEIWFTDTQTAAMCCCLERLRARWGPDGGQQVGRRLQQMKAAPTLEVLRTLPGHCRPCDGGDGNWLIDVAGIATIVFRPAPATDDAYESGMIVRATVLSVIEHPTRPGAP